jgi:hypothetical protein
MKDRTKNLQGFLDERSDREVSAITAVLQELEKSIRSTLTEKDDPQLQFDWSDEEKKQREFDLGSLRTRLKEIPIELEREVVHLRERFKNPEPRLFPVAVTFLIPHRAAKEMEGGSR